MSITTKSTRRRKIKLRIRKKIRGTAELPRLSVYRSNSQIYAQVINDDAAHTLISMFTGKADTTGTKSERAREVGRRVAAAAKEAGITQVVFDRNGYLYHGRVKAMAEGAREGGLIF
ncbi:MAG TPA: 50S ribosomal protein L18 [Chitinophagales bacterium]|nr:50S ribosomal protein L18 [Chitinophagales bacterium]